MQVRSTYMPVAEAQGISRNGLIQILLHSTLMAGDDGSHTTSKYSAVELKNAWLERVTDVEPYYGHIIPVLGMEGRWNRL